MTIALLQEVSAENVNISATTIAVTITGVTAGSTLVATVTVDDTGSNATISVSDGTSYTPVDQDRETTDVQFTKNFYLPNAGAGSHTVTATYDSSRLARGIVVAEIGGAATTSPLNAHNVGEQPTPGTGTDGVTISTTNTVQPVGIYGVSFRVPGGAAPAAGTGFTGPGGGATNTFWNFTTAAQARSEFKRVTTIGTQSATWTAAGNTEHSSFILVFAESGATGGNAAWGYEQPQQPSQRVVRAYSIPKAVEGFGPLPGLPATALTAWQNDQQQWPVKPSRGDQTVNPSPVVFTPTTPVDFGNDTPAPQPKPSRGDQRVNPAPTVFAQATPVGFGNDTPAPQPKPSRGDQSLNPAPAPFPGTTPVDWTNEPQAPQVKRSLGERRQYADSFPTPPAVVIGPSGFEPPAPRVNPFRAERRLPNGEPLPAPKLLWPLSIHSSGRYLVDASGAPFFHYGISAWSIFTEPDDYRPLVDDAAALGINMLLVRFIDKTTHNAPNLRDGTAPFNTPGDFTTLNNAYAIRFRDFIRYCAARGIFVWVAFAYDGFAGASTDGWRPEKVSNGTTGCNTLGLSIGTVLKDELNVGAIPGGDFTPPGTDHLDQNLIAGLQTNAPQITLVMAHPDQSTRSPQWTVSDDYPNVTSTVRGCYSWFGDTGGNNRTIYTVGRSQYNASPTRPVVYLEAEYRENTLNTQLGTDFTTRFQAIAFWLESVNGFGPGVGAEGFWPALLSGEPHGTIPPQAQGKDWSVSIALPCFTQLQNVKAFATSRSWWKLVPDQGSTLVTAGRGTYGTDSYRNAALASDGSFGLVYLPTGSTGGTVTVDMTKFYGPVLARWWSPTTNSYTSINSGVPFQPTGTQTFTAPSTSDFILALDASPVFSPTIQPQEPQKPRQERSLLVSASPDPIPALASAAITAYGWEAIAARVFGAPLSRRSFGGDILAALPLAVGWGFDPVPFVPKPSAGVRPLPPDLLPPVTLAVTWGWDPMGPPGHPTPAKRSGPSDFIPTPSLLAVTWGWDPAGPPSHPGKASLSAGGDVPPPVMLAVDWGWEPMGPVPRFVRPTLSWGGEPLPPPPLAVAWGWDWPGPTHRQFTAANRHPIGDPWPALAIVTLPPWGFEPPTPRSRLGAADRRLTYEPPFPAVANVTLPPWGFEPPTPAGKASRPNRQPFAEPLPAPFLVPWGYEPVLPRAVVFPPHAPVADPLAALTGAVPTWGWDPVAPAGSRIRVGRESIGQQWPLVLQQLTAWGFEPTTPGAISIRGHAPIGGEPMPINVVPVLVPWGYEPMGPPSMMHPVTRMSGGGPDFWPAPPIVFVAIAPRERTLIVLPHSRIFKVRA